MIIVANITDFPAPFKIYKKKFSQTPILKFQAEITGMLVFWQKLLKFLQGVYVC